MNPKRSLFRSAPLALTASMCCVLFSFAVADVAPGFEAALNADERPAEDKERDAARKPAKVLKFLGIDAGMTILDISASTGWYTEVLSAAVGPDGRVIAHNPVRRQERTESAIAAKAERLGNITVMFADFGNMGLDSVADAALTALNFHDLQNRGEASGQAFLGDAYKALKPGGVLGVIDHEGNAGQDNAALHRIEVEVTKSALEKAGFVVEAVSDILDNPEDDQTLNIRDESLQRNTDRFVIRARKPE